MPQLNPAPWLAILVFSWLIFAVIVPPKVLAHIFPNNPGAMDSKSTKMDAWAWPWQ